MPNQSMIIATAQGTATSAVSTTGNDFIRKSIPTGSWTAVTTGQVDDVECYVAISGIKTSARSFDGIAWITGELPVLTHLDYEDGTPDIPLSGLPHIPVVEWNHISYGEGIFVAIATGSKAYATSVDGVNWSKRYFPSTGRWSDLTWTDGVTHRQGVLTFAEQHIEENTAVIQPKAVISLGYVVTKAKLFIITERQSGRILKSANGIDWTETTVPIVFEDETYRADFSSVVYGKGKFLISSNGDTSFVLVSDNAITWTPIKIQTHVTISSVLYGNDEFTLITDGYRNPYNELTGETTRDFIRSYSSSDGVNWIPSQTGLDGIEFNTIYGANTKTAVAIHSGKGDAFITHDSLKTPERTFVFQQTDSALVGESRHYTAGISLTSTPNFNRQDIRWVPSTSINWYQSSTILSKAKISDHDQTDDPAIVINESEILFQSKRLLFCDYMIKHTGRRLENSQLFDQKRHHGNLTIQSERKIHGTTRFGFNWNKRALPGVSQWAGVTFGLGNFFTVSRDSIAAHSTTYGETWLASLMPSEVKWLVSTASNGKYLYSMSNPARPASTVTYSVVGAGAWRGGVLPGVQQDTIIAIASGQNSLYESFDGYTFKELEL